MKLFPIQKENAAENILLVMISAIFSFLSTRLYLQITDFPKIGTGSWHIAHAVIGGLFMIISTFLSISFYGKAVKQTSIIIFGLGTGLFIDEIGKLLSTDNNYFFQPTISLIYVFFVLIFLFYWYLSKNKTVNSKNHLYRAINKFEEAIESDLQKSEKESIIDNLNSSIKIGDPTLNLLAKQLKSVIQKIDELENRRTKRIKLFWQKTRNLAYKLFKKKLSLIILILVSLIYSLSAVFDFVFLLTNHTVETDNLFWLKTLSDLFVSLLFIIAIFVRLAKKTHLSLTLFRYGLLVNIFLSQIFKFYFQQFQAMLGLIISIIVYFGLKRLRQERLI